MQITPYHTRVFSSCKWQAVGQLLAVAVGALWLLLLMVRHTDAASVIAITIVPDHLYGVSGIVYDSDANPISGAEVSLMVSVGVQGSEEYAITKTDSASGYHFVGLPTGIYYLRFTVPNQCYFVQWYKQGTSPVDANPLIVNGSSLTGINITLTNGSCVTGTVFLDDENPAHDGMVTIYSDTVNGHIIVDNVPIGRDGSYYSHALTPGAYYACAETAHPSIPGCYLNESIAFTLPVTDSITHIDIPMHISASDGVISGTVTADGVPQSGIEVNLYSVEKRLVYTVSGDDGRFNFAGLASSIYEIGVRDPKGIYAATFYSGALSVDYANSLYLGSAGVISNVELSLARAGTLEGKEFDYLEYEGNYAFLYWQPDVVNAPSVWQWSGRICIPDGQHRFSFENVPDGRYRLSFGELCLYDYPDDCSRLGFYGGKDLASAADVVVEAGKTTHIDANRDFLQTVFLPIIQR